MPPTSRLRRLESLVDMPLYRFSRLLAEAGSLVVRLCEGRFGITRREWRLLSYLAAHPGLPPSELARLSGLDKAQSSRGVASLVDKQLVVRIGDPADRRRASLQLTERGRQLHDELLPLVREINRELLAELSEEDIDALDVLLSKLQARAEHLVTSFDAELPRALRHRGHVQRLRS
jgi:DNA-binding MarR family transcriptional regulator